MQAGRRLPLDRGHLFAGEVGDPQDGLVLLLEPGLEGIADDHPGGLVGGVELPVAVRALEPVPPVSATGSWARSRTGTRPRRRTHRPSAAGR